MADVRALLRSELAARSKASEGKQTKEHSTTSHPPTGQSLATSRKRKVAADEQNNTTKSKKSRSSSIEGPEGGIPRGKASTLSPQRTVAAPELEPVEEVEVHDTEEVAGADAGPADEVDEAEWAAFERDVATPEPEIRIPGVLNATATIEAKAMTAEELAAQARELESVQRNRKDVEAEEEKEEAQRQLEDELEDMEGYEDRVRKLRERRERLKIRDTSTSELTAGKMGDADSENVTRNVEITGIQSSNHKEDEDDNESESESESDVDEWGNWSK